MAPKFGAALANNFGAKIQTYVSISLVSLTGVCHDTVQPDYALKSEQCTP